MSGTPRVPRTRNRRFVVQMAGEPGSGKSAIARAVATATGAVVLDKDVIKSAALNAGADEGLASALAYEVLFDLTGSLLRMGHSVVLDSPAYFPSIRENGRRLAEEAGARYHVIECCCSDRGTLAGRVRGRKRMASQPDSLVDDLDARPRTAPLTEPRLSIDTGRPLADCVREALEYLRV